MAMKELKLLLPIQYFGGRVKKRLSIHKSGYRRQSLEDDKWYDHACKTELHEAIMIATEWLRVKIIGMGYQLIIRESVDFAAVTVLHHELAQNGQRYWRDKCFSGRCDSVFLALVKVYNELR